MSGDTPPSSAPRRQPEISQLFFAWAHSSCHSFSLLLLLLRHLLHHCLFLNKVAYLMHVRNNRNFGCVGLGSRKTHTVFGREGEGGFCESGRLENR